jgi:DNA-binding SARP family transcriptional activator
MDNLRIETLGGLSFFLNGERIKFSRRKAAALLVYLAVNQRPYAREILATTFWPENTRSRAYANLRQVIWDLRQTIGDKWLDTDGAIIALAAGQNIQVDLHDFHQLLLGVKKHRHTNEAVCVSCKRSLEEAAATLKGDFLAGFSLKDSVEFDDWQFFLADEVHRKTQVLYNQLVTVFVQEKHYESAIHYARQWLQGDNVNEETHRLLMQLYAENGQRDLALRQYTLCEKALETEFGVVPESQTTELYQKFLRGDIQSRKLRNPATSKAKTFLEQPKPVMPKYHTSFIGREKERADLVNILQQSEVRLLNIIAPGGMGKTRLAISIAQELEQYFEDGVFFIPFATLDASVILDSLAMMVNYIAEAIGFSLQQGRDAKTQIFDFFHEKSVLLILDNLEELLEEIAWLSDLLANCPNLKLLTTSRISLNLQIETRFFLSGLQLPTESTSADDYRKFSAIQLFLQNARRVNPGFKPEPLHWKRIGQICLLVGGMPLGIQMASAWIEMLSLEEIIDEIQLGMELFETELQDIPQRQRSLQTVFDYSWRMLSNDEKELFSKLSLFRGGFSRSVAQTIFRASLRKLVALANRSLIVRTDDDRFEIHELLRQYGFERLKESPILLHKTQQGFMEYYAQALAQWEPDFSSPRQQTVFAEIDDDFENIKQAWQLAVELRRQDLLELSVPGIMHYLSRRGRSLDGVEIAQYAFNKLVNDSEKNIRLLILISGWLTIFKFLSGNTDNIEKVFSVCENFNNQLQVRSDKDKFVRAMFYIFLAQYSSMTGNYEEKEKIYVNKAIPLFLEVGALNWVAQAYITTGFYTQGNLEHLSMAEKICRKLGDTQYLAHVLFSQAMYLLYNRADLEKAERKFSEILALNQSDDDRDSKLQNLHCNEHFSNMYGNFEDVIEYRKKILRYLKKRGNSFSVAETSILLGEGYHHVGQYQEAKRIGLMGLNIFKKEYKNSLYEIRAICYYSLTLIALQEYEVAKDLLPEIIEAGTKMDVSALGGLGRAMQLTLAIKNGDKKNNDSLLIESIKKGTQSTEAFYMFYVLAAAALHMAYTGKQQEALDLYAIINCWPFVANSQWFTDVYKLPLLKLVQAKENDINTNVTRSKSTLWQAAEDILRLYEEKLP